ncbi:DnaB-like helicase N-terminal domain-containing protein [Streptomyces phyllanthi]|uniref:Replicative DNA helicase n=1 Tax=Streptomyces phyllanthi TaxID=1803180 RepID=A0A5N8VWZ2_9ACTN|nr:DnaB-like helicase N-terminal domain-containing protein [Streptomyces phyllanthi]MPY39777.1 replicative DNA helicase [Streptomyces phyllanthi]
MDDDIDDLPPPDALLHAEQALLGALFAAPERLDDIGWLQPEHFYRPVHSALFAAMRSVDETEPGLAWLNAVVTRATQQTPGTTAVYAHTLIDACPRPSHATTYGRMVLAGHTRRSIREHADRLAQTAAESALPNRVVAICAQADTLSRHLEQLAADWRPHPGSLPRSPVTRPVTPCGDEERYADEQTFLAAATTHPAALKDIRAFLIPEDLSHPVHQELARCLLAMNRRGDPIDPVTVLWEAEHRGLLRDSDVTAQYVLGVCGRSSFDPVYWAYRIVDHAIVSTAAHAAEAIRQYTDDVTLRPHQIITGARRVLGTVTAVRIRRDAAGQPRMPPSPRAVRRGPPITPPRVTPLQSRLRQRSPSVLPNPTAPRARRQTS